MFYASEPTRGNVMVSHEGPYDLVVLSLSEHVPAVDLVTRVWNAVGADACAVLVGEELDVDDKQVDSLLEAEEIPADLDLCQAAVSKSPVRVSRRGRRGELVEHGGCLLLK